VAKRLQVKTVIFW